MAGVCPRAGAYRAGLVVGQIRCCSCTGLGWLHATGNTDQLLEQQSGPLKRCTWAVKEAARWLTGFWLLADYPGQRWLGAVEHPAGHRTALDSDAGNGSGSWARVFPGESVQFAAQVAFTG